MNKFLVTMKKIMLCIALLLVVLSMNANLNSNIILPGNDDGFAVDSISFDFDIEPIVPVAKDGSEQWKYVISKPSNNWYDKNYDDSSWSVGQGAFGTSNTYVKTNWGTSDIWLRKEFTLDGYSAEVIDSLLLMVYHDEDCEIYINGVLAAELGGYITKYKEVTISEDAKKSIVPGEKNVFAVHCYNGGGASIIDVGLYKYSPCTYFTFFNTADMKAATWKYVTETPDTLTWMLPTYDDSSWSEGIGGFGKSRTTHIINTQWTTNDLWLRKSINVKGFTKDDLKNLSLYVVRDATCEIYINGVLAATLEKNGLKIENVKLSSDAIDAISFDDEIVIAIHCYRTNSLKYFDARFTCNVFRLFSTVKWEMKQGSLMSKFAGDIDINNVLGEYPRPQMVRKEWKNLNGVWEFQPLFANHDGMPEDAYSMEILVPFPVESPISGIMKSYNRFAYRRTFVVPENWSGKRLLMHFDAVDYECEVYVNGKKAGEHKGGYDPFSFDVTEFLVDKDEQELVVKVYDPTDLGGQPRGKQTLNPGGIMYTCTSGIWQSVWMEPVEDIYIDKYTVLPDVDEGLVNVNVSVSGEVDSKVLVSVIDDGEVISSVETVAGTNTKISIENAKLWSPDTPYLYDLNITLLSEDDTLDVVDGYFGMRKISLETVNGYTKMCLNNEELFHMGTLDQGFWPDGLYTAPTDEAMLYDIEATKQMGFNMIRKHIKVEPRRWYYYCDKLGLLVWQDMPSANSYCSVHPDVDKKAFKTELKAMIEKLYNAPSVIMWVLFNEYQANHDAATLVNYIKSLDSSRLVNQDSGGALASIGDIWDLHHYPNPGFSAASNKKMATVCGEYGGLAYKLDGHLWSSGSWGYATISTAKELKNTYAQYIFDLVKFRYCLGMSGAVYTQITDVEIEVNGLMTYDRVVDKIPYAELAEINNRVVKSKLKKDTILAAAVDGATMWKMTTSQPSDDWYTVDFDDSSWRERKSGFGTSGTPNAIIGTSWTTSDIWIRKTFRLDGLDRTMADSLVMIMTHDEDCEIYINGKLLASYTGYDNNYSIVDFTSTVKNALLFDDDNVVAVHCKQTTGGQYIDLGIYLLSENGISTSVKEVNGDTEPVLNINKNEKSVSISGGGFGGKTRLEVINLNGVVVKDIIVGNETENLSLLPSGVYVIRFSDGDKKCIQKVTF